MNTQRGTECEARLRVNLSTELRTSCPDYAVAVALIPLGPRDFEEADQHMRYVVVEAEGSGSFLDPKVYLELLPTFAQNLPVGARTFATDADHYDFTGRRCVKDLQPDTVRHGETAGERWLELRFRHNCWKHEEDLIIRYSGVGDVVPSLSCHPSAWEDLSVLTLDEILPHDHGCSHEMRFLSGSLTITSRDLQATWVQADCPDKPGPDSRS